MEDTGIECNTLSADAALSALDLGEKGRRPAPGLQERRPTDSEATDPEEGLPCRDPRLGKDRKCPVRASLLDKDFAWVDNQAIADT